MRQVINRLQIFLKLESALDQAFLLFVDLDVDVVFDWRIDRWLQYFDLLVRLETLAFPVRQVHLFAQIFFLLHVIRKQK